MQRNTPQLQFTEVAHRLTSPAAGIEEGKAAHEQRAARGFSPPISHGKLLEGLERRRMWDSTIWSKVWAFSPCVPIP